MNKKILKRNVLFVIFLVLVIALTAGITYSASTYLYNSNVIGYDNTSSGLDSTDVQGALDEIYDTCVNSTNCPNGYTQYALNNSDGYKCVRTISFDTSSAISDEGINFGAISSDTNGKGLYLMAGTKDDAYPIYYYRGAVTNNNLLFANFCWKIVRTTDTGGIKLIYNGATAEGKCTNTTGTLTQIKASKFNPGYGNIQYIGYSYGTNNATDSTAKAAIEAWYKTYIDEKNDASGKSYSDYLEDTVWCNDRKGSATSLGARVRLYNNKSPSLVCQQNADKYTVSTDIGNGLSKYPVGLLTADEAAFAGAVWDTGNTKYYLYTNQHQWLMTPAYFSSETGAQIFVVQTNGKLKSDDADRGMYPVGLRPVISLRLGIDFTGGDGTASNPYRVE